MPACEVLRLSQHARCSSRSASFIAHAPKASHTFCCPRSADAQIVRSAPAWLPCTSSGRIERQSVEGIGPTPFPRRPSLVIVMFSCWPPPAGSRSPRIASAVADRCTSSSSSAFAALWRFSRFAYGRLRSPGASSRARSRLLTGSVSVCIESRVKRSVLQAVCGFCPQSGAQKKPPTLTRGPAPSYSAHASPSWAPGPSRGESPPGSARRVLLPLQRSQTYPNQVVLSLPSSWGISCAVHASPALGSPRAAAAAQRRRHLVVYAAPAPVVDVACRRRRSRRNAPRLNLYVGSHAGKSVGVRGE